MPNKHYSEINPSKKEKQGAEEIAEAGTKEEKKASFKETCNPSESVPVLPQQKGAE